MLWSLLAASRRTASGKRAAYESARRTGERRCWEAREAAMYISNLEYQYHSLDNTPSRAVDTSTAPDRPKKAGHWPAQTAFSPAAPCRRASHVWQPSGPAAARAPRLHRVQALPYLTLSPRLAAAAHPRALCPAVANTTACPAPDPRLISLSHCHLPSRTAAASAHQSIWL